MLVLSRKKRESVDIGDEVTLTVEEIRGTDDGQRIVGAVVRLGFESPRDIPIYRSELRSIGSGTAYAGRPRKPRPPRPGECVKISDAQVRLRIQVPRRIPVRCKGTATVEQVSEERFDDGTFASTAVHHITCHTEDRITICNNITIATLDVHRFVFSEHNR